MSTGPLVWAACPLCDTTWSEQVPEIGDRMGDLFRLVRDDLAWEAKHCRDMHPTAIAVGVEGLSYAPVSS